MGPAFRRGVFRLDGEARLLASADYPYFRDDPANWRPRLRAMRECGIDVLTTYVPWRHHAPHDPLRDGGEADFDGRTRPSRDVAGFLDLAADAGLLVLAKPGPFVHAELPYGGLPDYVSPAANPAVEPELDAWGRTVPWHGERVPPPQEFPLPAPFGHAYLAYVRRWLVDVAREVLAPRAWPRGPVVAVQLMNEGIYSDSADADPHQLGYAVSTLHRFHRFLADRYGSLEAYREVHGATVDDWEAIDPPRATRVLRDRRDLLAYLDWSAFQARLYAEAARAYRAYLTEGGLPADLPALFNFNPNGNTYRDRPASNDGWYTRVAAADDTEFTFGTTNWLGVVAGDPQAFRQYVMAVTACRGPAMEQNWGFASQYQAPYAYADPSHFETMVALAGGATGFAAYTFAGARAWRDDPNLRGGWVTERTSERGDATGGDYPGEPPVLSDGRRTRKYWTLRQLARFVRDEASAFADAGPRARLTWAMYPPYAWAGQWLPRGDPDDILWRPPLKAAPRGAYHGLDAFVEMALGRGVAFRQVDVGPDHARLPEEGVLCISAHEYMDAGTQDRLADWVEGGGALLLTNLVPDSDERLRPLRGALRRRVFPHEDVRAVALDGPEPVRRGEAFAGWALEFANLVDPPPDATDVLTLRGEPVGYERRVGRGRAAYLGAGPWRARWSGDDAKLARAAQAMCWDLAERLGGAPVARPLAQEAEVSVWQHGAADEDRALLYVLAREAEGEVEIEYERPGGRRARLRLRTPSSSAHALVVAEGRLRAAFLKGTNDLRGERVAPFAEAGGATIAADVPCDLCVTRSGALATRAEGEVRVTTPDGEIRVRAEGYDGTSAREPPPRRAR